MIAYLKGKVIAKSLDYIILLVGNTGYKVFVSENLPAQEGEEAELFCHLHVRKEEAMELYGLPSFRVLEMFEMLTSVSGIGPKAALAIASQGKPEDLEEAIKTGNQAFFKGIHGLGQKKIQKIIFELTGKLETAQKAGKAEDEELVSALLALGFSKKESRETASRVASQGSVEEKVKEALSFMHR